MKKTILIVDDFPNTRFVVRFTLQNKGYSILEASDGREALKFFDGRQIDLVITDFHMPNMNGLDLIKEVRKIAQYQYIPILVLTTETDQKAKDAASTSRVTGWVQKPFKMERFIIIVEKALR